MYDLAYFVDIEPFDLWNVLFCLKEENWKIGEVLFKWLMGGPDNVSLNKIDSEDPEVGDYILVPDTANLAENVKVSKHRIVILKNEAFRRGTQQVMTKNSL